MQYRLGELFSGPGGMSFGAKMAKVKIDGNLHEIIHRWASDIDQDSCETYRKNICPDLEGTVHHCDVKDLSIAELPEIDILAFGFPCNDFSLVGESKGMDGEFGMLYKYGVAAINTHNPIAFVAENVSGLSSSNEGAAFAQILSELRNAGKHGYELTAELHRFEHLGVPQSRHRYIIVGIQKNLNKKYVMPAFTHLTPITSQQALEDPPYHLREFGIKGKIPDGHPDHRIREPDEIVKRRLLAIPEGENAWHPDVEKDPQLRINTKTKLSSIYRRLHRKKPAYTVTGSGGGGTHMYHWKEPRALSNREKARLQTFPDDYKFIGGVTSVRKQIGMAVPPYGAKLIFETLLATLSDIPMLKIMSSPEPKIETFWAHRIKYVKSNHETIFSDSKLANLSNGQVMILTPQILAEDFKKSLELIQRWTSNGTSVRCILNDVWKDGMPQSIRDGILEAESSQDAFAIRSSFIKGNDAILVAKNEFGEVECIYAFPVDHSRDMGYLSSLRKIEVDQTLANHVTILCNEMAFAVLPKIDSIQSNAEMRDKISGDLDKFSNLEIHSEVAPSEDHEPTECIDLLAIARKSPVSSFNLEFGKGRRKDGSAGPRRWTEIEFTIGTKYSKLPNQFDAYTDDGKVIKLKRSGGSSPLGKDLASEGNRHLLGVWLKTKLYESGAMKRGERITEATLEAYGKTTLDFYKIKDSVYFMDFRPKDDKTA